ncbi:thiol:disulfide interchange protein DsbA/DsbL [Gallaecimonas sp. GXIMD4217]|uniref:thiol:disulfide interchange protein DsbA/DsbL n=1 Tax=Gallaecimonas sp. GXIMD4217 TaxID=3131927 RepID=UPI00311AD03F
MMKKGLLFLATLLLALPLFAAQFEEGRHYEVIEGAQATASPEVAEYFSFLCPHCHSFEPLVHGLAQSLPEGVPLRRFHAAGFGGNSGRLLTDAFAVMEVLEVTERVAPKVFDSVHVWHARPKTLADIRNLFVAAGVAGDDFELALKSMQVPLLKNRMQQRFQQARIKHLPELVVSGKYRVKRAAVPEQAQLNALVKYLLAKDA